MIYKDLMPPRNCLGLSRKGGTAAAFALLLACMTSCGSTHPSVSVQQRYELVVPSLRVVTRDSAFVSYDMNGVGSALQGSNATLTRARAGILHRHAMLLTNDSGLAAWKIRLLERRPMNTVLRRYFAFTIRALVHQWWESRYLVGLASILRSDPYSMVDSDASRVLRLSRAAQAQAAMAHTLSEQAAQWHQAHRKSFRYTPVTPQPTQ